MVGFDVIPVHYVARIALDYFLHSVGAQIGAASKNNIDEARGCGVSEGTCSLAQSRLSHAMDGDTFFLAKGICVVGSRVHLTADRYQRNQLFCHVSGNWYT